MNVDTSAPETSGTRGPSPSFLKRRHERMRNRLNSPESKEEEGRNLVDDSIPAIEVTLSGPRSSTASSAAVRSFRQLREKRKKRVPGGAAAKLIGKTYTEDIEEGPQGDEGETKEADADDDEEEVAVPTDEFIKIRDEAKDAFEKGTKNNRRYYETTPTAPEAPKEDVDARRAVNLEQGLHETPTAAVLSLLNGGETPKTSQGKTVGKSKCFPDGIPSVSSNWSIEQTPPPKDFTQTPAIEVTPRNAFQAPPRKDEHQNAGSDENSTSKLTISAVTSEEMERTTKGRNPLEQPLLSKKAEQRVAQMRDRMQDPSSTLADLIATIATPEDKTMSRGYMVRRKNACGALQVMTAKKTNRIPICWTLGVLPALSSVLEDSGTRDLAVEFQDVPTRKEFLEARKRAVGTLMNLSAPQENRIPVFHTPKMVVNLVQVIKLDQYEARKGCCAILAQLAKSKENRLLMVQVPGLIDEITSIIEPNVIIVPPKPISEDEEDDVSSSRTPDQEFADRNSSSEDETNETRSRGPFRSESFESTDVEISYKKEKEEDGKYKVDVSAVPTHDPAKAAKRYDEGPNEYLQGARLNVFALLSHLVKEKDNAYILARHKFLVDTLVEISKLHDSPAHEHAVKLLAHMTRHRGNPKFIVFKMRKIVPVLVKACFSQNDTTRRYACFALQNMSQDKPCRQELAVTDELLTALCVRIRQASDPVERLSAIHALKNLTDEPANLIPMTNTPECFATLMQIAHAGDDSVTEMMQFLGCDALATLSHWFRSIATSGHRIELTNQGLKPTKELFVPSLKIVTYQQWQ